MPILSFCHGCEHIEKDKEHDEPCANQCTYRQKGKVASMLPKRGVVGRSKPTKYNHNKIAEKGKEYRLKGWTWERIAVKLGVKSHVTVSSITLRKYPSLSGDMFNSKYDWKTLIPKCLELREMGMAWNDISKSLPKNQRPSGSAIAKRVTETRRDLKNSHKITIKGQ